MAPDFSWTNSNIKINLLAAENTVRSKTPQDFTQKSSKHKVNTKIEKNMSFGQTVDTVAAVLSSLKQEKSQQSRLSTQRVEMIEEMKEEDPKVKFFGSNPKRLVKVRMDYEREPEDLLASLTEFLFKNAGSIDFNSGPPDCWLTMFKGVVV